MRRLAILNGFDPQRRLPVELHSLEYPLRIHAPCTLLSHQTVDQKNHIFNTFFL